MFPEDNEGRDHIKMGKAYMRGALKAMLDLEDTRGFEIFGLVHALCHLYDFVESQNAGDLELSGPRWRLLTVLMAHEQFGDAEGLTPTSLSRFRGVSKNTISALLRGLERQGYIQRTLDPEDRRVFRIRLTDEGRDLVRSLAPGQIAFINDLASGLGDEEREQLIGLLEKLSRSVLAHSGLHGTPCCAKSRTEPSGGRPGDV